MSAMKEGLTFGKLKFTVTMKTSVNPIEEAQAVVVGLKTPGVMQKVVDAVESGSNAVDTVNEVSDQLQAIETIVSPLVKNLEIFAKLVTEFSKVSQCDCHRCREISVLS